MINISNTVACLEKWTIPMLSLLTSAQSSMFGEKNPITVHHPELILSVEHGAGGGGMMSVTSDLLFPFLTNALFNQ